MIQTHRRCARLLRERLEAELAMSDLGEHFRRISNLYGPPQVVRNTFLDMPACTEADWTAIATRMGRVPQAMDGYRATLAEGAQPGPDLRTPRGPHGDRPVR